MKKIEHKIYKIIRIDNINHVKNELESKMNNLTKRANRNYR